MSSNQGQSQQGQHQYPTQRQQHQGQSQSQQQYWSQYQQSQRQYHQNQGLNQPQYANPNPGQGQSQHVSQSSSSRTTAAVMPPTVATSAANVRSEQDCFQLLALELSSLPDRQMDPEGSDAAAVQQQQGARSASTSAVPGQASYPNTPTNNFIAKTIRAAMGEIKPSS
ncbi:hypothetical protein CCMA1212_007478 [Trichoderma ghanense]|uniref:Uncharacterized protein n=1 Tax=Trichoderma ghanense TaxID=65468 RepID=A0ABY2GX85_9HYPO